MLRRKTTIFSEAKPERLSEPERDRAAARRNKGGARGRRSYEDAKPLPPKPHHTRLPCVKGAPPLAVRDCALPQLAQKYAPIGDGRAAKSSRFLHTIAPSTANRDPPAPLRFAVFLPCKIPRRWRALRFDSAIAPLRMTHRGKHLLAQAIPS